MNFIQRFLHKRKLDYAARAGYNNKSDKSNDGLVNCQDASLASFNELKRMGINSRFVFGKRKGIPHMYVQSGEWCLDNSKPYAIKQHEVGMD